MLSDITLSTGRVVVHTRQPNGSTLATPTPGYYAFTGTENAEYQRITAEMKSRLAILERELLDCFNEQQQMEGFTVSDDSDDIYQASNGRDALFKNWVSDCRLDEAIEYNELISQGENNAYGF